MAPISKILVPVDLSARSLPGAAYAASLAAEFGSELVFLHALRNGWPLRNQEREIRDRLNAAAGPCRLLFREGPPARSIINTAEAERVDLIFMPTRGRPALRRMFGGSTAAQVLRGASCPVWVGLNGLFSLSDRPIRTILCGLSLGPRASAVLRWSANLARRLDAGLAVIHASKALEWNYCSPCAGDWRLRFQKTARSDIRELQAGIGTDGEVWLEPGNPLDAIPPVAGAIRADLLVLGKSPQKRLMSDLRTLSYEIACRVPCPVASV